MLDYRMCAFCTKMKELGVKRHNKDFCHSLTCECACWSMERLQEELDDLTSSEWDKAANQPNYRVMPQHPSEGNPDAN
jgi:hypothetical protein